MHNEKWFFGDFIFVPHLQLLLKIHSSGEYRMKLSVAERNILHTLLKRHGQICEKDELIYIAWEGRPVSNQSLPVAIASLRKHLSSGEKEIEIKNVPRKGYLIDCEDVLMETIIPSKSHEEIKSIPQPTISDSAVESKKNVKGFNSKKIRMFAYYFIFITPFIFLPASIFFAYFIWIPITCKEINTDSICYVNDGKAVMNKHSEFEPHQRIAISGKDSLILKKEIEKK